MNERTLIRAAVPLARALTINNFPVAKRAISYALCVPARALCLLFSINGSSVRIGR
jgi:hypothetical protein